MMKQRVRVVLSCGQSSSLDKWQNWSANQRGQAPKPKISTTPQHCKIKKELIILMRNLLPESPGTQRWTCSGVPPYLLLYGARPWNPSAQAKCPLSLSCLPEAQADISRRATGFQGPVSEKSPLCSIMVFLPQSTSYAVLMQSDAFLCKGPQSHVCLESSNKQYLKTKEQNVNPLIFLAFFTQDFKKIFLTSSMAVMFLLPGSLSSSCKIFAYSAWGKSRRNFLHLIWFKTGIWIS